jgi:hypothetical protein
VGPDYYAAREAISIDGSDHNRIIGNWFGALSRGGIYVYRNCGENGGVRQATPSHNHIVNNVFYYDHYNGSAPAVFLGSRNGIAPGFRWPWEESYCHKDRGRSIVPDSSSVDDRDFATHNVVMQNEVVKRSVSALNQSLNWENNAMNLVDRNQTVSRGTWPRPPAGCYVRGGEKEFILHGQTTQMFPRSDGSPACDEVTCHDGTLRPARPELSDAPPSAATPSCSTRTVPIDCRIDGENAGCKRTVYCPAGTKVLGAVAACNLENGAVTDDQLAKVPPHLIHVAKLSEHVPSGSCFVEGNAVIGKLVLTSFGGVFTAPRRQPEYVVPQSAVQTPIRGIAGRTSVAVGCKEFDENGGDCHIRGTLYCR